MIKYAVLIKFRSKTVALDVCSSEPLRGVLIAIHARVNYNIFMAINLRLWTKFRWMMHRDKDK